MSSSIKLEVVQKNECGGCTFCCRSFGISELDKPPWKPCEYQCSSGCKIYSTRPHSCEIFECMWLQGTLGLVAENKDLIKLRPDKLGLMFFVSDKTSKIEESIGHPIIFCHEKIPGANLKPRSQAVLRAITQKHIVVLINQDSTRRLIAPPVLMERLQKSQVFQSLMLTGKVPD